MYNWIEFSLTFFKKKLKMSLSIWHWDSGFTGLYKDKNNSLIVDDRVG